VRSMARAWLLGVAVAGLVLGAAACSSDRGAAGAKFQPVHPGVLTVATAFLPAPGFWEGDPPTQGFEAKLAAALADKLGLDRVQVVQVPFASIIRGKLGGADLALSQLTPTSKREKFVDFTTPYLTSPPGVLARVGVEARDVHGLKALQWVVSRTSTLTPILMSRVRPNEPPHEVEDRTEALEILRAGGADALLLDLPVALGLARAEPEQFHVLGQLSGGEGLAAALPDGSPNDEIVDSEIRALVANGTIGKLATRWLGKSTNDVPLILSEQ
jgi:polar amino acid transport system substrate-binding protein